MARASCSVTHYTLSLSVTFCTHFFPVTLSSLAVSRRLSLCLNGGCLGRRGARHTFVQKGKHVDAVALDERKAPHRSFIVIQFHAKEGESAPLVQQRGR